MTKITNEQLKDYIKKNLEKGQSARNIKEVLMRHGHREDEINTAFIDCRGIVENKKKLRYKKLAVATIITLIAAAILFLITSRDNSQTIIAANSNLGDSYHAKYDIVFKTGENYEDTKQYSNEIYRYGGDISKYQFRDKDGKMNAFIFNKTRTYCIEEKCIPFSTEHIATFESGIKDLNYYYTKAVYDLNNDINSTKIEKIDGMDCLAIPQKVWLCTKKNLPAFIKFNYPTWQAEFTIIEIEPLE